MLYIRQIDEPVVTYGQMNLIFSLRTMWREMATWTWIYMISRFTSINNIPEQVFNHLYQIPQELGNFLQYIFGYENTQKYLQLLSAQFVLIKEIIDSELAGNNNLTDEIVRQLYQNVDQRAKFVASFNSFWNEAEVRNLLYTYNRYTLEVFTTFLTRNYKDNFNILDMLLHHADSVGDYFSQGLFSFLTNNQQYQSPTDPQTGKKIHK